MFTEATSSSDAVNQPLSLALMISLLLHAYLLWQAFEFEPLEKKQREIINVSLAPKVKPKPQPVVQPKVKPKKTKLEPPKKPLKPKAPPKPPPRKLAAVDKPIPKPTTPPVAAPSPIAVPQAVQAPAVKAETTKAEPEWAMKARELVDTSLPVIDDEIAEPYQTVNSVYDVYADSSNQRTRATFGTAKIDYQRDGDLYQLSSEVHATGIMGMFLDDLIQRSRGKVLADGLQPDYFLYQYDKKKQEAFFDWPARQLMLKSRKGDQTKPLAKGTQDLLSFFFQFMFVSPLEQTGMTIANGKTVRRYQYQFMGEVKVKTGAGVFDTIYILRDDPVRNEQLGLWLAKDYQYLPVKIKKNKPNKNKTYELLIRHLYTDQGEARGDSSPEAIAQAKQEAVPMESTTRSKQQNTAPSSVVSPSFNPLIQR